VRFSLVRRRLGGFDKDRVIKKKKKVIIIIKGKKKGKCKRRRISIPIGISITRARGVVELKIICPWPDEEIRFPLPARENNNNMVE